MTRAELIKLLADIVPTTYEGASAEDVRVLTEDRAKRLAWAETATDEQIEDCIAEYEMSQQFWEKWDADMAEFTAGSPAQSS